jgi:NAD+ synthase (glutamine-hydrolysing)
MATMRIALAQIDTTVGDFEGNLAKIVAAIARARAAGAELVAFPELALCGYPPEDLVLSPAFLRDNAAYLGRAVAETSGICAVIGVVDSHHGHAHNAAAVACDRHLIDVYHKWLLPNYGVFDEKRYFDPGDEQAIFDCAAGRLGVSVCEDIWFDPGPPRRQAEAGAGLLVNISASPYHAGKGGEREQMLAARARDYGAAVAYVNLVGGQDELVFDGGSLVVDARGRVIARARQFEEELLVADVEVPAPTVAAGAPEPAAGAVRVIRVELPTHAERQPLAASVATPLPLEQEIYSALVLGTRDYVTKNGFDSVVLGLSGGIDSSLVATIAADALGPPRVVGVAMPSRYSSRASVDDASALCAKLGIRLEQIPIDPIFGAYLEVLGAVVDVAQSDLMQENLQARIRGNLLMALSNRFGWLVLTTGNKSEIAVGYCTLYGDTAGGFAVIKDVPKTLVYELARWRNGHGDRAVIPQSVLDKPPSAELRPDQKDTDSLPPYEALDPILEAYVEQDRAIEEIVAGEVEPALVRRVIGMVDRNEYKRRQAPPGIKITPRAFGRDRRMPITNAYGRTRG